MGFQDDKYLDFKYISTATTTTIATKSGRLGRVVINGGTLSGAITLYDGPVATGDIIAIIAATQVIGSVYEYNCVTKRGLVVVTAQAADITVMADQGA